MTYLDALQRPRYQYTCFFYRRWEVHLKHTLINAGATKYQYTRTKRNTALTIISDIKKREKEKKEDFVVPSKHNLKICLSVKGCRCLFFFVFFDKKCLNLPLNRTHIFHDRAGNWWDPTYLLFWGLFCFAFYFIFSPSVTFGLLLIIAYIYIYIYITHTQFSLYICIFKCAFVSVYTRPFAYAKEKKKKYFFVFAAFNLKHTWVLY